MEPKSKVLIRNVVIIEPSVEEDIEVAVKNLLVEPVYDLDDLLIWEERLCRIDQDYVIAEFDFDMDQPNKKRLKAERVYGIFVTMKEFKKEEVVANADEIDEEDLEDDSGDDVEVLESDAVNEFYDDVMNDWKDKNRLS